MEEEKNLADYRAELDEIDRRICMLYAERTAIVEEIGEYKKSHGIAVLDRSRENAIFDKIEKLCAEEGLDCPDELKELYSLIFTLSKKRQSRS